MRARLGESTADAFHVADAEASPCERIEQRAARDDVPSRTVPGDPELVEHLRLDERELVSAAGAAERSDACRVAVAVEALAGQRKRRVDRNERRLRGRSDEDARNRARAD